MLPLAILLKSRGYTVHGSDRSYDQGKTPEKFKALLNAGITLYPQDGSGVSSETSVLVVSSAVESSIPDVKTALDLGLPIIKRGALLAELFNHAKIRIAIAGTSGKSTVTGMVGTMLAGLGLNPTVVNGGEIRNFDGPFPSIRAGSADIFVAEMDESDGSILAYNPTIAVLNNIALDHKSLEELNQLFGDYLSRTSEAKVLNADHDRVMDLAPGLDNCIGYSTKSGDVYAGAIKPRADGIDFILNGQLPVHLKVPGVHNVYNALACLSVARSMKLDMADAIKALEGFKGIHRRLELIGTQNAITVYDDFGHNPDKIAATLETLKAFDGRLIVMFQPHGFGPLKLMGQEMVEVFCRYLGQKDVLIMPEAYYAGGTVDRSVTARHLIEDMKAKGIDAHWFLTRAEIPAFIKAKAIAGDRVVIMGARDDTLHDFATDLLGLFA